MFTSRNEEAVSIFLIISMILYLIENKWRPVGQSGLTAIEIVLY